MKGFRKSAFAVVLSATPFLAAAGQLLDQSQTLYDGGTSARLASGAVWQSFTAGITGTLTEVDMGFFAGNSPTYGTSWTGTGNLSLYAGTGTAGALLQSQTVNAWATSVPGSAPVCWNLWNTNVPSVSGSVYTFAFTPISGLPDPYGVAVGSINLTAPYTRGVYSVGPQFSENFKTWVTPSSVPEPGSTLALGIGLAGVLLLRRPR